jgi:tetratricopeptide (TPR) repeat protein
LSLFCNNRLLPGLIILLLLSSCSSIPKSRVESAGQQQQPADLPALPTDYDNALGLMQSRDYHSAVPALLDFIEDNPDLSGPYVNLGIAYQHMEQKEAAKAALGKAVELNPGNAAAHHQLGILYRQQGDFDSALSSYNNALKLDAGYALVHRNIGILYDLYLGQPALALEHYRKYLELAAAPDPDVDRWLVDLERRSGSAQARTDQQ